jgi:hypothetical protein
MITAKDNWSAGVSPHRRASVIDCPATSFIRTVMRNEFRATLIRVQLCPSVDEKS